MCIKFCESCRFFVVVLNGYQPDTTSFGNPKRVMFGIWDACPFLGHSSLFGTLVPDMFGIFKQVNIEELEVTNQISLKKNVYKVL